ncbi:hypothetical protein CDAR_454791 [Caerostris darwini]|uniref:Uncharacterized protein n=1 Tax=Caerostris darwini TaxID=1538125 RepID=A0AAV4TYT6_9ARAC|nr:hypothetical protein CDAR_454791 [Caerostris darwini]
MKYGLVKPQHKINKETPTLFAHGLLPPPRLKASGHHRSEPFLSCNRWSLSELIFWVDSSFLFMILFDGGGYALFSLLIDDPHPFDTNLSPSKSDARNRLPYCICFLVSFLGSSLSFQEPLRIWYGRREDPSENSEDKRGFYAVCGKASTPYLRAKGHGDLSRVLRASTGFQTFCYLFVSTEMPPSRSLMDIVKIARNVTVRASAHFLGMFGLTFTTAQVFAVFEISKKDSCGNRDTGSLKFDK